MPSDRWHINHRSEFDFVAQKGVFDVPSLRSLLTQVDNTLSQTVETHRSFGHVRPSDISDLHFDSDILRKSLGHLVHSVGTPAASRTAKLTTTPEAANSWGALSQPSLPIAFGHIA